MQRQSLPPEFDADRKAAERAARATPLPPFRFGEVWERRGQRFTLLCSRALRSKVARFVPGRKKMKLVRAGNRAMVKVMVQDSGLIFEGEAALMFNDPRWPAKRIGRNTGLAQMARRAAARMRAARLVRSNTPAAGDNEQE